MHDTISTQYPKGGLLPLRKSHHHEGTKRQIDFGIYAIYRGEMQVGEVYVESGPGYTNDSAHTVEHWCLYAEYEAPSPEQPRVTLELRYNNGNGTYTNASEFLHHVASLSGVRYIRAVCDQLVPPGGA